MKDFEVPEMAEIMGGNSGFEFSPVQLVASIPLATEGIITTAISMVAGYTMKLGYATPGTLSYSEIAEGTRAGTIFKLSVKGFFPKASAAMISLFEEMCRQKFILLVSEISSEKMLLGNKNEPLSFIYSKSSKSAPGEKPGYDFEFWGITTRASVQYAPAL